MSSAIGPMLELVRAGCALADDHQLLGGVVGVALETRVRVRKHLVGQLVRRHRERRDVADPQRLRRLLRGVLEVLRVVVAAVDDHQVLDAAGDEELAVVVGAVVAGAHPRRVVGRALGVRRVGPRLEDVLERRVRLLGLAPVAGAHVLAADPDLADLPVRQLGGRLVVDDHGPLSDADLARAGLCHGTRRIGGNLDEGAGVQRIAVDIDDPGLGVHRRSGHEQRRLGQAVGRLDGLRLESVRAERLVEPAHRGGRDRLAAVEDALHHAQVQRRFVVLGQSAGSGVVEREVGRHRDDAAGVVWPGRHLPHPSAGPADERRRGHEGEVVADHRRQHRRDQPHVVEERQPRAAAVALLAVERLDDLHDVGGQVEVGDLHAGRDARRTGRVLQVGDRVDVDVRPAPTWRRPRRAPRRRR